MVDKHIEILQLTDLHLPAVPDQRLWGVNTLDTFQAALEDALGRYPRTDLILLTGDLAHEPHAGAYELLRDDLRRVQRPVYCLPGNHDDAELMARLLMGGNVKSDRSILMDHWHLVLLDSNGPAKRGGRLLRTELDYLEIYLKAYPGHHTLVCLHHHPVPVMSKWMDEMALENAHELFDVLDRHPQVQGVVCGHVHQEFAIRRKDAQLMTTPSTCVQFVPRADSFARDTLGPGYRWLRLGADGTLETHVHYLSLETNR